VGWCKKKPNKRPRRVIDHHHILPRSRGGNGDNGNVIAVSRDKHIAYHTLFGNKKPDEIVRYLKEFWFKDKLKLEWWK